MRFIKPLAGIALLFCSFSLLGQPLLNKDTQSREHHLFDLGWKFALGHATNAQLDFTNGTSYFSYLAKTGYGDGAAAAKFDDRAWRNLDLPHDWCVELPFAANGGHSHGYKAIGRNYPENSVGWYRKSFSIPASDFGKKISIEFEGVFRNAIVWVNGFYCGTEQSGYRSFEYDISDYLNYGGENVVAVRADATMEEGWYYEGAGIYRHVYLNKVNPLHVSRYGTFVTSQITENNANISIETTVENNYGEATRFSIQQTIVDAMGNTVVKAKTENLNLPPVSAHSFIESVLIDKPSLWSIETPYLYQLTTEIIVNNNIVDCYTTDFGVRSVRFDANKGFFLNGKSLKIVGANNHQDHAGVGSALPDALVEWRINKMKEMGANAIRTSHEPPSPAFLKACDKLGMLVLAENRLTGSNQYHFAQLEDFMKRDRNHPSIVLWSLGNEEWAVEGNETGVRITQTMQKFAKTLDTTRAFTTAISGGWDNGTGKVVEIMGYNYIAQGDIDRHHKLFPWQPSIGTEETNSMATRGIYVTNETNGHIQPTFTDPTKPGAEYGWNFYNDREFLSGIFFWTGFDYRGEPTPFAWPAVTSQFGIVDLCGFPKDIFYYLKSWWQPQPVMHVWPHWNWAGDEGKQKTVTVYSNCQQVELFLNNKSLGKKEMPRNGHLEWVVAYQPGKLLAKGYNNGKFTIEKAVETTTEPKALSLSADRLAIAANNADVSVITVQVNDAKKRMVPTANIDLEFEIEGPGKIIGVGNGNPSSHEPERYFETITTLNIEGLKEMPVDNLVERKEVQPDVDVSLWKKAFDDKSRPWNVYEDTLLVVRGTFQLPELTEKMIINLFTKSIVENQSIYVNGRHIASNVKRDDPNQSFKLDMSILQKGTNTFAVTGQRFRKQHKWDEPNTNPGLVQVIEPTATWKRKSFNGLAQVLVQSTGKSGQIVLKAKSNNLTEGQITIVSE